MDALKAFYSLYDTSTSDLKTSLTGGLWLIQAPQQVSLPYGVYRLSESAPEEICGAAEKRIERSEIVLTLYADRSDGGDALLDLMADADEAFHWPDGGLTEYNLLSCRRIYQSEIEINENLIAGILRYELKLVYD